MAIGARWRRCRRSAGPVPQAAWRSVSRRSTASVRSIRPSDALSCRNTRPSTPCALRAMRPFIEPPAGSVISASAPISSAQLCSRPTPPREMSWIFACTSGRHGFAALLRGQRRECARRAAARRRRHAKLQSGSRSPPTAASPRYGQPPPRLSVSPGCPRARSQPTDEVLSGTVQKPSGLLRQLHVRPNQRPCVDAAAPHHVPPMHQVRLASPGRRTACSTSHAKSASC